MMRLADSAVAVAEVAVDAAPTGDMVAIVRASEGGPLCDPEVRFDGIEPGGVGGRGDRVDVQAPAERQEARMIMDVVEAEELLGAFAAVIGSPHALRPATTPPGDPAQRLELQGSPLVEADHRRPRRTRPVELADAFFFRSNAGSSEVFQVRIRWARSPSRRRSRRTHSSVIGCSSPLCRQYSASLGTVHAENGRPRSAGLDRAMSISSRIWGL